MRVRTLLVATIAIAATLVLVAEATQPTPPAAAQARGPGPLEHRAGLDVGAAPPPREIASVSTDARSLPSTIPVPTVAPPLAIDELLADLRDACATGSRDRRREILAEIRTLLAGDDPEVERAVALAVSAGGKAATQLRFLVLTYPDHDRRRVLKERLAEAAAPPPEGAPDLVDAAAVAVFLGGARDVDDKLWVLRRLEDDAIASPDVRRYLADTVLRSPEGGALASIALRLLRRGPREETEAIALRAHETATTREFRRTAIRLLGTVAGPEGRTRLLRVLETGSDDIERRLAADAFVGRPLDQACVVVLLAVAENGREDPLVRRHAARAILAASRRGGPIGDHARSALRRIPRSALAVEGDPTSACLGSPSKTDADEHGERHP